MPKIYHRLCEAAILDCNSASILNKINLRAPAIYHCAQAVEKCLKATYAYYMMKIEGMSEGDM
jgi:HEPN domain-containing protein